MQSLKRPIRRRRYANVWDPSSRYFCPRSSDGKFHCPASFAPELWAERAEFGGDKTNGCLLWRMSLLILTVIWQSSDQESCSLERTGTLRGTRRSGDGLFHTTSADWSSFSAETSLSQESWRSFFNEALTRDGPAQTCRIRELLIAPSLSHPLALSLALSLFLPLCRSLSRAQPPSQHGAVFSQISQ